MLIAEVAGCDRRRRPTARLSSDLNLDSLQRVELLGVIEEELGAYIDDDALDPEATVADLIAWSTPHAAPKRDDGHLRLAAQPGRAGRRASASRSLIM